MAHYSEFTIGSSFWSSSIKSETKEFMEKNNINSNLNIYCVSLFFKGFSYFRFLNSFNSLMTSVESDVFNSFGSSVDTKVFMTEFNQAVFESFSDEEQDVITQQQMRTDGVREDVFIKERNYTVVLFPHLIAVLAEAKKLSYYHMTKFMIDDPLMVIESHNLHYDENVDIHDAETFRYCRCPAYNVAVITLSPYEVSALRSVKNMPSHGHVTSSIGIINYLNSIDDRVSTFLTYFNRAINNNSAGRPAPFSICSTIANYYAEEEPAAFNYWFNNPTAIPPKELISAFLVKCKRHSFLSHASYFQKGHVLTNNSLIGTIKTAAPSYYLKKGDLTYFHFFTLQERIRSATIVAAKMGDIYIADTSVKVTQYWNIIVLPTLSDIASKQVCKTLNENNKFPIEEYSRKVSQSGWICIEHNGRRTGLFLNVELYTCTYDERLLVLIYHILTRCEGQNQLVYSLGAIPEAVYGIEKDPLVEYLLIAVQALTDVFMRIELEKKAPGSVKARSFAVCKEILLEYRRKNLPDITVLIFNNDNNLDSNTTA